MGPGISKGYYKDLDRLVASLIHFLNQYQKSAPLQAYAKDELGSFFYANLALNFFNNLTFENVRELRLPQGQIGKIRKRYSSRLKTVRAALSTGGKAFLARDYEAFKRDLERSHPAFLKLLSAVEEAVGFKKASNYLRQKGREIDKAGKLAKDVQDTFTTALLAAFVKKKHRLPSTRDIEKLTRKTITPELLAKLARPVVHALDKAAEDMLAAEGLRRTAFEANLYARWKQPLDLLECLIKIATEAGERKARALAKSPVYTSSFKRSALVQLHARAVHIATEVLTLLRSGFADGANSRWRSLYELAVVSFFLHAQPDEISERFLAHDVMKRYKEAKEYQAASERLGYPPFGRKSLNKLRREHDNLVAKYGKKFKYQQGYEWIPPSAIWGVAASGKTRVTFRDLEKHVGLGMWRPFYSLSSNAIHSGPRGFFRLGLIRQGEVLLTGASNYGLADPLQNTGISLSQVTTSLLTLEPDVEDLLTLEAMRVYFDRAGASAVRVQKAIERDDKKIRRSDKSRAK